MLPRRRRNHLGAVLLASLIGGASSALLPRSCALLGRRCRSRTIARVRPLFASSRSSRAGQEEEEEEAAVAVEEEDWDEPIEPPVDDDEEEVESVAAYFPMLLQIKYGDDWEKLLDGDDPADTDDVVEDEEYEDEEALEAAYVEMEALGLDDDDDVDGLKEEELRWLVDMQMKRDLERLEAGEEEAMDVEGVLDDDDEDAAADDDVEEEEEDELEVLTAAVAELGPLEPSPSLAAFVEQFEQGAAGVPQPYPASEWSLVLACSFADEARYMELINTWANLRVLLFNNFGDLACDDAFAGSDDDGPRQVRQRALLKARTVHAMTGLGAIAASTTAQVGPDGSKPASESLYEVETEGRLDELIERARPGSASERCVEYTAAASFVGEGLELHGFGSCSMPLEFAGTHHTTIALSAALDSLLVTVSETLGLKFVGTDAFEDFYKLQEMKRGGKLRKKAAGALLLREKILREATVLDSGILKVSSFLNHMVDVELMEACGEELAERLEETQATKVLTVEATGLLPAMFVGKALQVPVVFARKSRQIGVADSYQTSYKSATHGDAKDLYVSTEYLMPGDRVIIIDDFLAGGATADAMVRLCRMANAKVVAGGFLIEKLNDAGRAFLSGYQIPLEALAAVSIDSGRIRVLDDADVAAQTDAAASATPSGLSSAVQLANELDNIATAERERAVAAERQPEPTLDGEASGFEGGGGGAEEGRDALADGEGLQDELDVVAVEPNRDETS